jgi:hypothetical protein
MAEGNETPGGEPPRRSEGDLLAERRARRAAETGEAALTRRADAAEATVLTLETHVATLQVRLREAEEESARMAERADAEKAAVLEREAELRRVKQREYAEQQLRVEAEDRLTDLDREGRLQIERLNRRLSTSEQEARELARRLESVQRQLAEAEQAAAAERTAVRRAERELQARLTELECRALEIHRGLSAERAARERTEGQLESMRRGHRMVESLVGETRAIVARLTAAFARGQPEGRPPAMQRPQGECSPWGSQQPADQAPTVPRAGTARSGEMAQALAEAVERLRARVEEPATEAGERPGEPQQPPGGSQPPAEVQQPPAEVQQPPAEAQQPPAASDAPAVPTSEPGAVHDAAATDTPATPAGGRRRTEMSHLLAPAMPAQRHVSRAPHKHSLSLIGRWRIRRKQRRSR